MKNFNVTIKGVTPYMQHRMDDTKLDAWEKKRGQIIERDDVGHEASVRAEFHCYRNADGKCFIPMEHLKGAFIAGGGMVKGKVGNRTRSLKNIVAGMFFVRPYQILLPDYDTVDQRSAVNKNVKGRVIVIRPKWTNWEASFQLQVDNDTITKETIAEIISSAGSYIGIGSYRPACNGEFGRFELASFEEIK